MAILKNLTREEWDGLKQGMTKELTRLGSEVGVGESVTGDRKNLVGVEFTRFSHPEYLGEYGKKDGDVIYHFYPAMDGKIPCFHWPDIMGPYVAHAFATVFPHNDGLWDYCPELANPDDDPAEPKRVGSIVVCLPGAARNLFIDDLLPRVFEELNRTLPPASAPSV
jgi:hypothetical protein